MIKRDKGIKQFKKEIYELQELIGLEANLINLDNCHDKSIQQIEDWLERLEILKNQLNYRLIDYRNYKSKLMPIKDLVTK